MDNYIKIETLGRGTYGNVYLVKNIHNLKLYALKKMTLNKKEKKQSINIENEIAILNSLDHPNIVKYIESFEDKGKFCIVMEHCDCGDIKSLIVKEKKQNRNINEDMIWDWFFQIVNALKYLHSKKIIHRDIKPENIFMNKSGQIKLGDFGISKILLNQDFAQTSLGTPYYLSPEICKGKAYNHKIDIWMLGCFIYEVCNFHRPFQAQTLMNIIINDKHNRNNPIYSEDLQNLVDVLLEKDQEARPSINELLELPFVKSRIKKFSPTNNVIKNKHFIYKNNLHIEIEDLTPNSSNGIKFNSKIYNGDFNSEIEKKELETLKKNLISSPLSNLSKELHENMSNKGSPFKNLNIRVTSSYTNVNFTPAFQANMKIPLYDKMYRSNIRTKSNNCTNNMNSNISSYEGEINLNNDNCSIYKNQTSLFKSTIQNKMRPSKTTHSFYNLIKPKQNNNIQKISINITPSQTPDSNNVNRESIEKLDQSIFNMDFIQDNSSYEKKVKIKQKFNTDDITLNENLFKKLSSHDSQDLTISAYQSKNSLIQMLRDKIGRDKLNLLLEAIDKSESPYEFINNVDLVTSFCGLENKEFTIDILKRFITSIKTPSNGSTSTQYSFH